MTYEESDENWAAGMLNSTEGAESKRNKNLSKMRERIGNQQATPQDEQLFNKWADDVDKGSASLPSTDFVNAMKNEGGWEQDGEDGPWKPNSEPKPAPPDCENKDCLGVCNGSYKTDENGDCCKDLDRDCAGKCYGRSITVQHGGNSVCCDRTSQDSALFCCKNPLDNCHPKCPKPGQIKNGHASTFGCWCTPGDEHCCPESTLDSDGKCPASPDYKVWAFEGSNSSVCLCNEVLARLLESGTKFFMSEDKCKAACPNSTQGGDN